MQGLQKSKKLISHLIRSNVGGGERTDDGEDGLKKDEYCKHCRGLRITAIRQLGGWIDDKVQMIVEVWSGMGARRRRMVLCVYGHISGYLLLT